MDRKESNMERAEKTWLLQIVVAAIVTATLAALAGLWGWTALKVIENGERIVEVKAELQKELGSEIAEVRVDLQRDLGSEIAKNREQIAEVKTELGRDIAEVNAKIAAMDAKLDLLIGALDITVAPEESAGAGPSGAERGGFQAGAGETATQ